MAVPYMQEALNSNEKNTFWTRSKFPLQRFKNRTVIFVNLDFYKNVNSKDASFHQIGLDTNTNSTVTGCCSGAAAVPPSAATTAGRRSYSSRGGTARAATTSAWQRQRRRATAVTVRWPSTSPRRSRPVWRPASRSPARSCTAYPKTQLHRMYYIRMASTEVQQRRPPPIRCSGAVVEAAGWVLEAAWVA